MEKSFFDGKNIEVLARKYDLKLLLLFGSRASGETHPMSDYDFGYISARKLDYSQQTNFQSDLAQTIDFQNVEVTDLMEAGPFLLREIIRNHRTIFFVEDSYENFYAYAVRMYLDEKRLFDLDRALYQETLKKYQQRYA